MTAGATQGKTAPPLGDDERTAFWAALEKNRKDEIHAAVAKYGAALLSMHKADMEIMETAFQLAIRRCDRETLAFMIAHGANLQQRHPRSGSTPLLIAAENSTLDVVELFVEHGASVHETDKDNCGALDKAVRNRAHGRDIIAFLLQKGADLEAPVNVLKWTPLGRAIAMNNMATVEFLLENGAKLDCIDYAGHTPLQMAEERKYTEIIAVIHAHIERRAQAQVRETTQAQVDKLKPRHAPTLTLKRKMI